MFDDPTLLIVDDEKSICEACQRIFSRQGFHVDKTTDAQEGLRQAVEYDYSGVLLDIKMPRLDGIGFLKVLRRTKPDLPVVLITGYPSIPNATEAIRWGASDFVTKPFTPEEITRAVHRSLSHSGANNTDSDALVRTKSWTAASDEIQFWHESWFQVGSDQSVRAGAVLTASQQMVAERVRLPGIGESVYQGLPLAGLVSADKLVATLASPMTGVVVAVNKSLAEDSANLFDDPCGKGWVAQISPTAFEEDARNCRVRRVVLVNADEGTAREQRKHLIRLGCVVRLARDWEQMEPLIEDNSWKVVLLDDASFYGHGPRLVGQIHGAARSNLGLPRESTLGILPKKVVVIAAGDCQFETEYREQRVFYYAVEPFADNEIVSILDTAYRPCPWESTARAQRHAAVSHFVSGIATTNWNGKTLCLLVDGGLVSIDDGLGWYVRHKLQDQLYPVRTTSWEGRITPVRILETAGNCDRLLVLLARDTGRLQGSLTREANEEFSWSAAEHAGKVTTLIVQPPNPGADLSELDDRTARAIAEHVVREMSSCV